MSESINLDCWFPSFTAIAEIDAYLIEEWRIGHIFDLESQVALMEKIGRKKWRNFQSLISKKSEKLVTDAMTDFDIHAIHVSQFRRAYVLDQMAVTFALMNRMGTSGDVLDIGCQNGVLLTYFARRFPNAFYGIDPSLKSIEFAQHRNEQLTNLVFEVGSLPASLDRKYDLIICNDVLHHLKGSDQNAAASSIFASLNDGMAAIISTQTFEDRSWWDAIQPAMSEHGISLVAGGRVGGCIHGGSGFLAAKWASSGLGVFQKSGITGSVDVDALVKRFNFYWADFFAPYANNPSIPWSQKTMAYEASRRSK
jgi:2-polyprenyl-3-methyl-5-hydroxy-6-metoxy-1,4-benzoquinol methylase